MSATVEVREAAAVERKRGNECRAVGRRRTGAGAVRRRVAVVSDRVTGDERGGVGVRRGAVRWRGSGPARLAGGDPAVWTIVLAGGEGERLRPLMERWLGCHRPKQYCAFVGRRSMLRHTLDRAERLSGAERVRVVVARHHEWGAWDDLDGYDRKAVIAQPDNRDTAAGVFLPLTYVGARDAGATVVILPSDHFVYPEGAFVAAVRRAVGAAQSFADRLVLLGARPDGPETEYGWIEPGQVVGFNGGVPIREVVGFREKPGAGEARRLLRSGGVWNTMIVAAQWRTLWALGWECFPELMERFEEFAMHIGTERERAVLEALYEELPAVNFSSGLLERAPGASVVMELEGALWSDWGNERRIVETLRRIGRSPSFMTMEAEADREALSAA